MYLRIQHFFVFLTLLSISVATGCKPKNSTAAGPTGGGMPPAQVVALDARTQAVSEKISLVGSLLADESVEIKSEIDGTVAKINFEEGQRVEKGALLVQLDESKLSALLAESEANLKLAKASYERAQQLFKDKLISQQEFDQAASGFQSNEATVLLRGQQLKEAKIVAPFSGVVGARNISPGEVISTTTILTWLNDLDPIKVEMNVPERFVGVLKEGQRVDLKVAAYPQAKYTGDIYFIAQHLDPTNRTALTKAKVPNANGELKPGMFANLEITLAVYSNAVVIPEAALSRIVDGNKAMVFVVDQESTARIKPVKLGVRLPGWVQITEGIQAGESVIVEGTQKIGPGSKVKLAPPESAAPYLGQAKQS